MALLPWGDVFEDWLDPLGVSSEEFRDAFMGSWMFGYVEALRAAGVRTVLVCVTSRVDAPRSWTHVPTGATIHLLPPPRAFGVVRPRMLREPLAGSRDPRKLSGAFLRHLAPLVATPAASLARVLRVEGCTAVVCQEYETPRFDVCVVLGRLLGLPVFATFQGGDYQVSRLERPLRPLTVRAAAGLIVATQSEAERLQARYGISERKVARIFNPIDLSIWRPEDRADARSTLAISPEAEVVVWHGQVQIWRKGLDVLLDAWARVCTARGDRNLQLLLVGAGEDAGELRRLIDARRLHGVRMIEEWISDRTRIRRFLSAGDVYAFPSRHEGFPVAPIEAMACGLPVVAADAQGVPDILAAGEEHGGLVVPRDDSAALALALGRLLDDEALRSELGRRARRRIESSFGLEAVGTQLRAFLIDRNWCNERDELRSDSGASPA